MSPGGIEPPIVRFVAGSLIRWATATDFVVPRPGIEPGEQALRRRCRGPPPEARRCCCWRPASESNAVLPGSLPEARFRRAGHVALWCPANESNVARPESESRAWVPPGGARVCWSRQRESHSRSARTGRVSYCWTMTASVLRGAFWWSESDSNRSRARCELTLRACGRPMKIAWCPRKELNLPPPGSQPGARPSSYVGAKAIEDGADYRTNKSQRSA